MKIFICFVSFFWAIPQGFAQLNLVQLEQIDSLQKAEERNLIVFIQTDWCRYCKAMQATTFKNEAVVKMLNKSFYFVVFDAEEKRKIVFNNTAFSFKPNGPNSGIHELALELATINKQISYPSICILNSKNEIVFQYSGFLNAKDLSVILEKLKN